MPYILKRTAQPAACLKKGCSRRSGRTQGGLNCKLHAIFDAAGRPVMMCLTEGQTSDHTGAKTLYPALPDDTQAVMIADKGYDSDEYRAALKAKGITACIPAKGTEITGFIL